MSFVISLSDRVIYPGPPPAQADVIVIGGGIAGICTALFLARAGQRVVLCEKGRIAGEQSSRNWGWIRQQGRDPAELPIVMEAIRHWETFAAELGPELGYKRCGVAYYSHAEGAQAGFEEWVRIAAAHDLESRVLTPAQIREITPNAAAWKAGLVTPSDARAEPWAAVPLIAHLAVREGVEIVENCAVRALDVAAGRVVGVVTEMGRVRAPRVLLAGGAWSALFLAAHGIRLPQLSVRSSVAQTAPMDGPPGPSGVDEHFAWRKRADGGYTLAPGTLHDFFIGPDAFRNLGLYIPQIRRDLSHTRLHLRAPEAGFPDGWHTPRKWSVDGVSPFETMRILDPVPNAAFLAQVQRDFAATFPESGAPTLLKTWAGMIDVMPDTVPVLDAAPLEGLFIATGLSGHGFGIGPGVGRVMADLMQGRAPGHDLSRFRFARFAEGGPMDLGPTF